MLEKSAKSLEKSAKDVDEMSATARDISRASELMERVAGQRGIREPLKLLLERTYRDLHRRNREWTRRRVRAIFNKEAKRIDAFEIEDLDALARAREEHAAYKAETTRIAALATGQDASIDRGKTEGLDGGGGGMDSTRTD